MTTITLKINERTKAGKAILSLLNFFTSKEVGVEILKNEKNNKKIIDENTYNPKFVKMVLDASKSKNRTTVTSKNLWQSI